MAACWSIPTPVAEKVAVRLTGARVAKWKDLFLSLYHRKIKSAIFTFEPTTSGDAVADLSAKLEAYETALMPVMSEYVDRPRPQHLHPHP